MTGQQLRNSILQEAIQGRLVPNVLEPGEKAGAELLQQILKERQDRENKEKGKKAKKLILSTIEDEPWELPEGWCWCKIGDIFDHSAGKSLNSSKQSIGKVYPYLTTSNVYYGGINFEKIKEMPFTEEEYKKCSAIKNDILVCEGGDVGRSCIWTYDYSIGLQNHVHRLRAIKDTDVKFVNYVLRFYKAAGIITAKGIGIGGFSANALKGLSIPLPPLSIQHRIVEKIEELLPLIDEYDKAAVELETLNKILPDKLRKSVIQEAIHGTLVSNNIPEGEATGAELLQQILKERQDRENKEKGKKAKKLTLSTIEDEPWELPEGWCWGALGDIVLNRDSERVPLSVDVRSRQLNKQYDYYGPGGAFDKVDDYLFDKRLLLIGEDGANLLTRSKPNAFFAEGKYWVNNHVHVLDSLLSDSIILDYIALRVNGMSLADYVTGTAQPKMNQEKMNSIPIPLPPLSIQHRIVEKIEEVFAAIDNLQV